MPTYEYKCQKCGHQFERFQSIADPPLTRCPQTRCRGKVKRLIGMGAGLIFKGSGFYSTDYRSESYNAAAKKESDSGKPKSTTADTKTDSKTGSKPASKPAAAKQTAPSKT